MSVQNVRISAGCKQQSRQNVSITLTGPWVQSVLLGSESDFVFSQIEELLREKH